MNNLILGNCLEKEIPKCRLLLTDIPYEEVNRKSNGLRKLDKENADKKTFEIEEFLNHIYKWFPSSKLCNECGCVNSKLKLGQMSWTCPSCGELINRDYNASKNIKEEGFRILSKELAC